MKKILSAFLFATLLLSATAMPGCGNDDTGSSSHILSEKSTQNVSDEASEELSEEAAVSAEEQRFVYDRVIIIGVDGAGALTPPPWTIFSKAERQAMMF